MKIYRDLNNFRAKRPVLTTGTFDGVHLGHKQVLEQLKAIARREEGETVVFTFYPHPRQVLHPEEHNLRLLTTLEEKISLLEQSGIDHLIVYPFTREFSRLSYSEFVKSILVDRIRTHYLVVGYDHKFGKDREGGFEFLQQCAEQHQFNIEKLDALTLNDIHISSTKIRNALQEGNISQANHYLGYPFTLHGQVVEGQQLGRRIQFPTANIEASDPNKIIPGYGVYAVQAEVGGQYYQGMLNIGTRPTVNNNADHRSIEVHILNFEGNLYGEVIGLVFEEKIREEQKFNSLDSLKAQLELDKKAVQTFFTKRQAGNSH